MSKKGKGQGWHGEPKRHMMSRYGYKTVLPDGRRLHMGNFVASGEFDKEYIEREIKNFQRDFCPYGYLDIQQAILHMDAYGKNSEDLIEALNEFVNDTGMDRNDIDITALAYDEILQDIRNEIDSEIDFDIQNDADFYTAGNYMATTYDWSRNDIENLTNAIKSADKKSRDNLLSNDNIRTWLFEVDIDINEFK